jgi:hypothetical protein
VWPEIVALVKRDVTDIVFYNKNKYLSNSEEEDKSESNDEN